MTRFLRLSMIALLLSATPLLAQMDEPAAPTAPAAADSPDVTAAREAAKTFMLGLADKDVSVVRKQFAGTDEDFKLVQTMHGLFQAGLRLKTVAEKRWPEEVKKEMKSDDMDPKLIAARIDKEQVTIEGDSAKFSGGALLKKIDGKWQVVDLMNEPMGKGLIMGMFGALTPLMNEAADDIESGKYKTFAEAQAAIKQKMTAGMGGGRRGAVPGTMPAGGPERTAPAQAPAH